MGLEVTPSNLVRWRGCGNWFQAILTFCIPNIKSLMASPYINFETHDYGFSSYPRARENKILFFTSSCFFPLNKYDLNIVRLTRSVQIHWISVNRQPSWQKVWWFLSKLVRIFRTESRWQLYSVLVDCNGCSKLCIEFIVHFTSS